MLVTLYSLTKLTVRCWLMCVVFGTGLSRRCLGDNFDQRLRMTHTSFVVTADNRFILAVGFWDKSFRVFSTDSGSSARNETNDCNLQYFLYLCESLCVHMLQIVMDRHAVLW